MFTAEDLEHFKREISQEAIDSLSQSMTETASGWFNFFSRKKEQVQFRAYPDFQEVWGETRTLFMQMVQLGMRRAQEDAAAIIEQRFPTEAGRVAAETLRDVCNVIDYNS